MNVYLPFTVPHVWWPCTIWRQTGMLCCYVMATKHGWDKRTGRFKEKRPCFSFPAFTIHGGGKDSGHTFYRYTRYNTYIFTQNIPIVVRYNIWNEELGAIISFRKLYHTTIEIFKLDKIIYVDQATSWNIINTVYCSDARLEKRTFAEEHLHSMDIQCFFNVALTFTKRKRNLWQLQLFYRRTFADRLDGFRGTTACWENF